MQRGQSLTNNTSPSYQKILNLEGSIFKWANESRPMIRDSGSTHKVHPYNRNYASMLRAPIRNDR